MFELKNINDLIALAHAGGGFTIDASIKNTNDLIAIAAAANKGGARVTFTGVSLKNHHDLIAIAHAGGGNIVFADK